MKFSVDSQIFAKLGSETRVYFALVEGLQYDDELAGELSNEFEQFQADLRNRALEQDFNHDSVVAAWDDAFSAVGLADSGVKVSIANMWERIVGAGKNLASVHPLVDYYNMFVLDSGIAMGAYDFDRLTGDIAVKLAVGNESFRQLGKKDWQTADKDEIILADDSEVHCRYWVWKQSETAKIRPITKNVLLRFEVQGMDQEVAYKKIVQFIADLGVRFQPENVDLITLNAENPVFEQKISTKMQEARERVCKAQELLNRGVSEVNVYEDLEAELLSGRQLRVKFGIDPTGSDLTLGHAVPLRKLRQFQEAGHHVILMFGTFTGQIGDPTGKSQTREPLTKEQVLKNVETYLEQAAKIIDVDSLEVRHNGEWLEKMDFGDVLKLAGNFTVAQMLERDMYQERMKAGREINLVEFMYPLMQGYDSVPLEADVEIGGTDQLFNMMCARPIQKRQGQKPQNVMTVPLMVGLDGSEKMSKSLGNYIGINDSAEEMYGKTMSIPDHLLANYFELGTDMPMAEIAELEGRMAAGKLNPRDAKMRLAREITGQFYAEGEVSKAEEQFVKVFQKGENPDEVELVKLGQERMPIVDLLMAAELVSSTSEARRMLKQGAVKIDDEKVEGIDVEIDLAKERMVRVGKRKFKRVMQG